MREVGENPSPNPSLGLNPDDLHLCLNPHPFLGRLEVLHPRFYPGQGGCNPRGRPPTDLFLGLRGTRHRLCQVNVRVTVRVRVTFSLSPLLSNPNPNPNPIPNLLGERLVNAKREGLLAYTLC
jgi:hypothetical protein